MERLSTDLGQRIPEAARSTMSGVLKMEGEPMVPRQNPKNPRSRPEIGRTHRKRWINQEIKKKLLEEGNPEECAICGAKDALHVNHDTTGFVRGLLCGRCDKSLELFEGNPALFRQAAAYLDRPLTRYVVGESIHLDIKPRR